MNNRDFSTFLKKRVLLILFVFLFITRFLYAGLWTFLSPNTTSNSLNSVHFIDANKGWAVGEAGTIIRTDDGGQSWKHFPMGFVNTFKAVFFSTQSKGWIVGGDGIILGTKDGGATWQVQSSGVTEYLNDVEFINESTGWIVGGNGQVLKTIDGGQTWTKKTSGTDKTLYALDFVDDQYGWATGSDAVVIKTVNGGETWSATSISAFTLYGVCFVSRSIGWTVSNLGTIKKTTNGGQSWTSQTSGSTAYLRDVKFINENVGWVIGDSEILYTSNGGSSWSKQQTAISTSYSSSYFLDSKTGWIVGYGGSVEHTTSGGTQWLSQQTGSIDGNINAIQFLSQNEGWATGRDGKIVHTIDGGISWSAQTSNVSVNLYDIFMLDNLTGWIVGYDKTILMTGDGGNTWALKNSGIDTYYNLDKVQFVDKNNGWVMTSREVFKTTDGGKNWKKQDSYSGDYRDMFFIGSTTGWIVTSQGKIRKTTDGGSSWFDQYSTTKFQLYDVYALNQDTVWAVGTNGSILFSANGGTTWDSRSSGYSGYLYQVQFLTRKIGWIAGDSGNLLYTNDGGNNWYTMKTGSASQIRDFSFIDENTGWALTGGLMFYDKQFFQHPQIAVIPAGISFGQVPKGRTKNTNIQIYNIGGGFLNIHSITTDNSQFSVSASSAAIFSSNNFVLTVTYTPTVAGPVQGNIIFQTNDPINPIFKAPLKAIGREFPVVFVNKNASGTGDGASWANAMTLIQPAINLASELEGLEVWVAKGTYNENLSMNPGVGLYGGFNGNEKTIAERDVEKNPTVIDGKYQGAVIKFPWWKDNMVVDGFTITHGSGYGLNVDDVGATIIRNCKVEYNSGTGLWIRGFGTNNQITRCLIRNNTYGIDANNCETIIFNNTIVNNSSAGIKSIGYYVPTPTIYNCIFWGNGDDLASTAVATYSCIEDGDAGEGNFSSNPLFDQTFHLTLNSPCIDAGAPGSPLDPDGTPADIGAYYYDLSSILGRLSGLVVNSKTQAPIASATVKLTGPNEQVTYSDFNGKYMLLDRAGKNYRVSFYSPNYDSFMVQNIEIVARDTSVVNSSLNPILAQPRRARLEIENDKTEFRWRSPAQLIAFDDGSFENAVGFQGVPGYLAIGPFKPSLYPVAIEKVSVCFNGLRAGDKVDVIIYIDPNSIADRPSDFFKVATIGPLTISSSGNFQEIDLTALNLVLNSGNFFIGLRQQAQEPMFVRWDYDDYGDRAFLDTNLDGYFTTFRELSPPFPGVPAIRAIIAVQSGRRTVLQTGANSPINHISLATPAKKDSVATILIAKSYSSDRLLKENLNLSAAKNLIPTPIFSLTGYNIYRSESSPVKITNANIIGKTDPYTTLFIDKKLLVGRKYYYVLSAVYDAGETVLLSEFEANIQPLKPGPTVRLEPDSSIVRTKKTLQARVVVDSVNNLGRFEFTILYHGAIISTNPENVNLGNFIGSTGRTVTKIGPTIENRLGELSFGATTTGSQPGASAITGGLLATIEWIPVDTGVTDVELIDVRLKDVNNNLILNTKNQDGLVHVTDAFWADIDADEDVDIVDIQLVASHWNTSVGSSGYDPICDVDFEGTGDGDIDIVDIQLVAAWWNKNIPSSLPSLPLFVDASPACNPGLKIVSKGETGLGICQFEIWINNVKDLAGFQFEILTPGTDLVLESIEAGEFLHKSGRTYLPLGPALNSTTRRFSYGGFSFGDNAGISGSGILAVINLKSDRPDDALLELENIQLVDSQGKLLSTPIVTKTDNRIEGLPMTFYLRQNYPNPFNAITRVCYGIPSTIKKPVKATLIIYNILGEKVCIPVNDEQAAGHYSLIWNGKNDQGLDLPSGVYYYKFIAGDFSHTRKFLLLK